jgi:hypothetical protein
MTQLAARPGSGTGGLCGRVDLGPEYGQNEGKTAGNFAQNSGYGAEENHRKGWLGLTFAAREREQTP